MKQIIQDLKKGNTILEDVPAPLIRKGHVLIRTHRSLVSLGTEKMLVEFGKSNLLNKARQQPDKVKQVLDKIKSDGLLPTLEAVFNKLDEPLPLGYCNAGEVIGVAQDVTEFKIGDRVVSNGHHAEVVCIPKNLVAKIPENVTYEEAVFTVVASIGLQGIRLVEPTLGETVVVIGLGLIGLLTAELLVANGCRVIGFDFDDNKVSIAKSKGILAFNSSKSDPVSTVMGLTSDIGTDAVIITASTKSNDVISQSARMSRKKGRIVLVGVIGLDIQRADFYKKELSFQVSCSYGAGRYDDDYELKGIDYPLPYVRWTQKRNFETILSALESKKLQVQELITERVPLENYLDVYNNLGSGSIASILDYSNVKQQAQTNSDTVKLPLVKATPVGALSAGVIGAGNYTKMTVLPNLKKVGLICKYISSAGGLTARSLSKKYNIENSTTDYKNILSDQSVNLTLILTRHDLHASMIIESLQAGKHVFVEKPLALNKAELSSIQEAYMDAKKAVTINVGYNRRFSPHILKAKQLLGESHPINIIATMNAGYIPADFWVNDMNIGGGRIVGEACHLIDLMISITQSKVISVSMSALGNNPELNTDNAILTLKFENGSQGVINYFSNGHKSYSKERVEIYSRGRTLIIDNFKRTTGFGFKGFSSLKTTLDKGHRKQFELLKNNLETSGEALIPFDELINGAEASFAALESLQTNKPVLLQS
jgi:predicted dehydrogenase/threonine dehydrogenase-like Zn-dependent dehydrogenase